MKTLSRFDEQRLTAIHPYAAKRYDQYRNRYGHDSALDYALAWAMNMAEQRNRRAAHRTGYVENGEQS
jgi:hypothetical protein